MTGSDIRNNNTREVHITFDRGLSPSKFTCLVTLPSDVIRKFFSDYFCISAKEMLSLV